MFVLRFGFEVNGLRIRTLPTSADPAGAPPSVCQRCGPPRRSDCLIKPFIQGPIGKKTTTTKTSKIKMAKDRLMLGGRV